MRRAMMRVYAFVCLVALVVLGSAGCIGGPRESPPIDNRSSSPQIPQFQGNRLVANFTAVINESRVDGQGNNYGDYDNCIAIKPAGAKAIHVLGGNVSAEWDANVPDARELSFGLLGAGTYLHHEGASPLKWEIPTADRNGTLQLFLTGAPTSPGQPVLIVLDQVVKWRVDLMTQESVEWRSLGCSGPG